MYIVTRMFTYIVFITSLISVNVGSRLAKNSGTAALIVKYMSNFLLVFSSENLHPLRNVMRRTSSVRKDEK